METGEKLKQFIQRIERMEEEKAGIAQDIKEIYASAKSEGFDPKIMKEIVKIRKQDPEQREMEEEILETYKAALGI